MRRLLLLAYTACTPHGPDDFAVTELDPLLGVAVDDDRVADVAELHAALVAVDEANPGLLSLPDEPFEFFASFSVYTPTDWHQPERDPFPLFVQVWRSFGREGTVGLSVTGEGTNVLALDDMGALGGEWTVSVLGRHSGYGLSTHNNLDVIRTPFAAADLARVHDLLAPLLGDRWHLRATGFDAPIALTYASMYDHTEGAALFNPYVFDSEADPRLSEGLDAALQRGCRRRVEDHLERLDALRSGAIDRFAEESDGAIDDVLAQHEGAVVWETLRSGRCDFPELDDAGDLLGVLDARYQLPGRSLLDAGAVGARLPMATLFKRELGGPALDADPWRVDQSWYREQPFRPHVLDHLAAWLPTATGIHVLHSAGDLSNTVPLDTPGVTHHALPAEDEFVVPLDVDLDALRTIAVDLGVREP